MTVDPTQVTSDVLQSLLQAALVRKDAAGNFPTGIGSNWFTPRDWPTTAGEMPIGLIQSPTETKESLGRNGAPQFTVTTKIRLIARVASKAGTGEAGAVAALAATSMLQRQVEVAVVNDFELFQVIQQCKSIEVVNGVRKDGEFHFGELVMDFALEFYQGPEAFAPNVVTPIEELAIYADLINVFSPSGDFTGSPEATPFVAEAQPAPRTQGPDGRAEGAAIVTLPQ